MKTIVILSLLLLSGCASIKEWGQDTLTYGARANDNALEGAEAIICRATSIGAIIRKYGQDASKARAWRELCVESNDAAVDIVRP